MFTATCEKYPQLVVYKVCRFQDGKATVNERQAAKLRELPAEYGVTVDGAAPAVADAEKPLEKRTVPELKAYAAEHEIDLGAATKKPDILAAIVAAERPPTTRATTTSPMLTPRKTKTRPTTTPDELNREGGPHG